MDEGKWDPDPGLLISKREIGEELSVRLGWQVRKQGWCPSPQTVVLPVN